MMHCDLCDWTSQPRVRNSKGRLEVSKGRVRFWYSENSVSVIIEDGLGEDDPLVEVEVSLEVLKAVLAVAEIDRFDPYAETDRRCCGNSSQDPQAGPF